MTEADQELIDAIERAWLSASMEGMGGYVVMDATAQRVLSRIDMELTALDRVCSPAGLKSLFPGLGGLARARAHLEGRR